jgi:hypothetical protein
VKTVEQKEGTPMTSGRNSAARAKPSEPIEQAAAKTAQVQQELAVAEAELHLTNTVLGRAMPDPDKQGDVRKAVKHNIEIEETVCEAAEELQEVKDILQAEVGARERLESDLKRRASS